MFRTHYKPRTHHRDGYGASATLDQLLRNNGRDLVNASDAIIVLHDQPRQSKQIADRYALMATAEGRAALRQFDARKRAARKAA